jgi:uncharacterized protein
MEINMIRFDRSTQLAPLSDIPPEAVIDGAANSSGHVFFAGNDKEFISGIWACTDCVVATPGYPHDEMCTVLTGELQTTDAAGKTETFRTGDCFIIPSGWSGQWKMSGGFSKGYVIRNLGDH